MKKIIFIICLILSVTVALALLLMPVQINADYNNPNFTIEYGKTETVYLYQPNQCGPDTDDWHYFMDMPARALFDSDGNLQLYTSLNTTRKFIGNNLNDVKKDCHIIMESHKNPDPRMYDDYEWLMSPYTIDGTTIYSLVHTEYHGWEHNNCNKGKAQGFPDDYNCWWNSINLAKSTDKGYTFTHATAPNNNIANTSINYGPNNIAGAMGLFQSSNILKKDGYYYATLSSIFTGDQHACIMRTNNLDDPNSWRFWNGTDFSLNPKNITPTNNCARINTFDFDIQWSTYLNRYTSVGTWGNSIWTGATLTSWDQGKDIAKAETDDNLMQVYSTLLQPGAETRNFEDVGRSPWMYYIVSRVGLKRTRVRFNRPEDVGKYDVLDLRFNEYKGTKTLDSSFYGNDGTLSGGVSFKQEGEAKFIHFADSSGKITVSPDNSLNMAGNITITTRIKTTQHPAVNTFPIIVAKQEGGKRNYGLYLTSDGKVHFSVCNGACTGSVSNRVINDGNWHDIQITFSDSTGIVGFVIDGQLDNTVSQGGKLSDGINNAPIIVGGDGFIGDLDHITIYNYLLSAPTSTPIPTSAPTSTPKPSATSVPQVTNTPYPTQKPALQGDIANSKGYATPDGHVDSYDATALVSNFGKTGVAGFILADINKDGKVNIFDYSIVVGNFGR